MNKIKLLLGFTALSTMLFFAACEKPQEPITGVLKGMVTDKATTLAIAGAKVFIYDATTNAPTGKVLTTDASGNYRTELNPGNYFVRVSKQGYYDAPPSVMPAIPFTIVKADSLSKVVEMYSNGLTNIGWISGKLSPASAVTASALVVAVNGTSGYSTVADSEGNYIIYNVPIGSYTVKAWGAGFSSDSLTALVATNTETPNVNLTLSTGAVGSVTGAITFLATGNAQVDVTLTHPITKEPIPGLTAMTVSQSYTITNVPNGTYLARASYKNDTKVMDPDWIVKNGEPYVTVSGGAATRNFSVTGAMLVVSPTNLSTSTVPTQITSTTPTFDWDAYPSSSDYVIEVTDASGQLIWGGFSSNWATRNVIIPSSQTSCVFNFDGTATTSLVVGKVYHWRVFASKDVSGGASWDLISVSEDQMGLFEVQ